MNNEINMSDCKTLNWIERGQGCKTSSYNVAINAINFESSVFTWNISFRLLFSTNRINKLCALLFLSSEFSPTHTLAHWIITAVYSHRQFIQIESNFEWHFVCASHRVPIPNVWEWEGMSESNFISLISFVRSIALFTEVEVKKHTHENIERNETISRRNS